MLEFLRKFYSHTAGKIITIIIGALFIIGFSFLPYLMGVGGGIPSNDVATVNGKGISLNDLSNYYGKLKSEYERLYGNKLTNSELKKLDLTGSALSSLIANGVLESKKDVFGVHVSNGFIARNIASFSVFQKNGSFSNKLFISVLINNHLTPAKFEKNYKSEIARSYIKRIISESFTMINRQFLNDYMIKNKSVSFEIAIFKSKKAAAGFLKKIILYGGKFTGQAKSFGGMTKKIPLFSEVNLVKSDYFKKYLQSGSILKAIFSVPANTEAGRVFSVKSGFAVIKVLRVYFPKYFSELANKDGKNSAAKQKELYRLEKRQEFLDHYVDYLESKADVKVNKSVLSSFRPY
ncbi:SurA N-terminal domain-containing protein [Candidatus Acidulodesulfobacterium sp. H_13]|uniref:SurA N-terminal domain-containing protein n=1 Tax=Candidatus Acidulodesulfobacterium sp. H_13 TaxID=3395470 RepID=UPI003AF7BB42